MTDYEMKLANHNNFYQKQMDVAMRLEAAILDRYIDFKESTYFDLIVRQEVKKELARINEAKSMTKPNPPNYYRANND